MCATIVGAARHPVKERSSAGASRLRSGLGCLGPKRFVTPVCARRPRSPLACRAMQTSPKPTDYVDTLVLPHDELAARRTHKQATLPSSPPSTRELSAEQVLRLLRD